MNKSIGKIWLIICVVVIIFACVYSGTYFVKITVLHKNIHIAQKELDEKNKELDAKINAKQKERNSWQERANVYSKDIEYMEKVQGILRKIGKEESIWTGNSLSIVNSNWDKEGATRTENFKNKQNLILSLITPLEILSPIMSYSAEYNSRRTSDVLTGINRNVNNYVIKEVNPYLQLADEDIVTINAKNYALQNLMVRGREQGTMLNCLEVYRLMDIENLKDEWLKADKARAITKLSVASVRLATAEELYSTFLSSSGNTVTEIKRQMADIDKILSAEGSNGLDKKTANCIWLKAYKLEKDSIEAIANTYDTPSPLLNRGYRAFTGSHTSRTIMEWQSRNENSGLLYIDEGIQGSDTDHIFSCYTSEGKVFYVNDLTTKGEAYLHNGDYLTFNAVLPVIFKKQVEGSQWIIDNLNNKKYFCDGGEYFYYRPRLSR